MNILLNVVKHKTSKKIPVWFMRQAGRYLPEYRQIRTKHSNFFDFCLNVNDATMVTLQPLKRFDLDAAILFSDILIVPYAMGQKVNFIPGKGPILKALENIEDLNNLPSDNFKDIINPVSEIITNVKAKLNDNKSLIGFAGAPWTLACYMLEGSGSKNFDKARRIATQNQKLFDKLMDELVSYTCKYLIMQINAGIDVIKIFDSWAGLCPARMFKDAVIHPVNRIIKHIKKLHPNIPIIYFPKGAGEKYELIYKNIAIDCLAIDHFIDPTIIQKNINPQIAIQGGIDPQIVYAGGDLLKAEVFKYLNIFKDSSYIFNMGHGMVPDMPIKNVTQTIDYVRQWEKKNF